MWILGYVCVVAVFIQGMDCDHGQGHVNNKGKINGIKYILIEMNNYFKRP